MRKSRKTVLGAAAVWGMAMIFGGSMACAEDEIAADIAAFASEAQTEAGEQQPADEQAVPHYLTPYQLVNMDTYDNDEVEAFYMMGTEYKHGVVPDNYNSFRQALYNLDGEFSQVTLEVGHIDNERNGSANLYVYADGTVINTLELTSDMITQKITIDTTGVLQLRLDMDGGDAGYGFANILGFGGHTLEREMTKMVSAVNDGIYTYTCTNCGYTYEEEVAKQSECIPYLTPYQATNLFSLEETEDTTDCIYLMGKPYDKGLSITNYDPNREALYNLGQAYTSVTFTVGHIDGERLGEATLRVFTDGAQMKELPLEYTMQNQAVTINTEGVTQLKITYEGGDSAYGIVDMSYETNVPREHSFISEVVLEATATQSGIRTYTCENCGATYSEAIPALGQ